MSGSPDVRITGTSLKPRASSLDYDSRLRSRLRITITITSTKDRQRASGLDDGSRSLSHPRYSSMPKPPTRRAGRTLVAPGASPGSVPPAVAKARPARRVECGLELKGNDDTTPAVGLGLRDHPFLPRTRSYSTRFAGRPSVQGCVQGPGFHPGLPMFDPRPAGRRRATMTNEKYH